MLAATAKRQTHTTYICTYTYARVQSGKLSRKGSQGSHVVTLPYETKHTKKNKIQINKIAK